MTDATKFPIADFMLRLRKIDKSGLTARDVLMLYTIITHPGINGHDAGRKIGLKERSSVTFGMNRLIKRGFIEDRREENLIGKGVPNRLYVLPAGVQFWEEFNL